MQQAISWMTFFFPTSSTLFPITLLCAIVDPPPASDPLLLLFDSNTTDKKVSLCSVAYSCPVIS